MALAAALLTGMQAGTSQAAFSLDITQGSAPSFTAPDLSTAAGVTYWVDASGMQRFRATDIVVGDFRISFTGGRTNTPGSPTLGTLQLDNFEVERVSNNYAADLVVRLTATGFTSPTPPVGHRAIFDGRFATATATGAQISFSSILDRNNTPFGGSDNSTLNFSVSQAAGGGGTTLSQGGITFPAAYSLTNVIAFRNILVGAENMVSHGGLTTNVVAPAPQGLLLVLGALPVLGLAGLYHRRRLTAAGAAVAA